MSKIRYDRYGHDELLLDLNQVTHNLSNIYMPVNDCLLLQVCPRSDCNSCKKQESFEFMLYRKIRKEIGTYNFIYQQYTIIKIKQEIYYDSGQQEFQLLKPIYTMDRFLYDNLSTRVGYQYLDTINPHTNFELYNFTKNYLQNFDKLHNQLEILKKLKLDHQSQEQVRQLQQQLIQTTNNFVNVGQGMNNSMQRRGMESQYERLKKKIQELQKKHADIQNKHALLESRVQKLEGQMVTMEQLQQIQAKFGEKLQLFEEQLQVAKDQRDKLYVYVDKKFQQTLKPSQKFICQLQELKQDNPRMFAYARRLYWSLMNQILAYRTLSTGLVAKGRVHGKFHQIKDAINTASDLIGGVPVLGNILNIVKEVASMLMQKQDELVIQNMAVCVQGYYTQGQISDDIANVVMMLANNQLVKKRVLEYKIPQEPTKLQRFLNIIDFAGSVPDRVLRKVTRRITGIKKARDDVDGINQNIVTDCSLLVWQMVQNAFKKHRQPITQAACIFLARLKKQNAQQAQQMVFYQGERPKYFKINVMRADLTIKKQTFGRMNPYYVVKYGPNQQTSEIHKKGDMNPRWQQQFVFESEQKPMPLTISIYDKQKIFSDDYLGTATIIDTQLTPDSQTADLWIDSDHSGKIHFILDL